MAPLVAQGQDGRPSGLAVCLHQHIPADSLLQTWGTAARFVLTPRLREPDTLAAADHLLVQWREHLAGLPEAHMDDTSAIITWPSRDVSGVRALLRHGMQPMAVLAARLAGRQAPPAGPEKDLVIREAVADDLDAVTDLEMGVILYDAYFGGSIPRPATRALTREGSRASLQQRPSWTWLAERAGKAVGLITVQPPKDAAWPGGIPAVHVRPPGGAGRRGGRRAGRACARRPRRTRGRGDVAALRAGEPGVRAVLEPDGVPAAVDDLGGAPRGCTPLAGQA